MKTIEQAQKCLENGLTMIAMRLMSQAISELEAFRG